MTFYTPKNIEDLNKLKKLINQKRNFKKQRLNREIQKTTLNYDLAEQHAPIMKLQEKQIKRHEDHTQAIADQTKMLEAITTPAIKSPLPEAIEVNENDENEENVPIRAFDADISDMISSLLIQVNTHQQMKFSRQDFNIYTINDKPFELYDNILEFDNTINRISPTFFKIFIKGNDLKSKASSKEELKHLNDFVDYAGGLV